MLVGRVLELRKINPHLFISKIKLYLLTGIILFCEYYAINEERISMNIIPTRYLQLVLLKDPKVVKKKHIYCNLI